MEQFRTNPIIAFIEALLRGAGNVLMQNNPLSGLIIIIGIAINSWLAAFDFLVGATIATLVAMWFKADEGAIKNGMFALGGGYVGLLVGIFASLDATLTPQLIALLVLGGILAVPVSSGLSEVFGKFKLSAAAFPILILVWAMLAGILYTDLPQNSVAPQAFPPPSNAEPWSIQTFVVGIGNSFGQIFVQVNPLSGYVILLGVLINSRISGIMGVVGIMVGLLTGFVFGYDAAAMASGAITFNALLASVALGGFFIVLTRKGVIYAVLGSLLSMWFFFVLSAILNPIGLPAISLPFVVVYWLMALGAQTYEFVTLVPLRKLSKPEEHLKFMPP